MWLGIEIGGTKLQLGVGSRERSDLQELARENIVPDDGAEGILRRIDRLAPPLLARHQVEGIGIGFGGPVDRSTGRVITSHQITGWDGFALVDWCRSRFERPVTLANDCDCATWAEAHRGAGQGAGSVFYVTVGTGIGGGFVHHQQVFGTSRPAACEIGHLRPHLHARQNQGTVESLASGWGIAAAARQRVAEVMRRKTSNRGAYDPAADAAALHRQLVAPAEADRGGAADLLERCQHDVTRITAVEVAQAAAAGNQLAQSVLQDAFQTLGWAIAQTITLLAPEVVVIGGGVSLLGESQFFEPVREAVAKYVFPALADSYRIVPAALGESVVVHGALLIAADHQPAHN